MNSSTTPIATSPSLANSLVQATTSHIVVTKLEAVTHEREEATPDREFFPDGIELAYDWLCVGLSSLFKPREVDDLRMKQICRSDYWETEYRHYEGALKRISPEKARTAQSEGGECPSTDHWRGLALLFRDLLRSTGMSLTEVRDLRRLIRDQRYWKLEADVLQWRQKFREYEMREARLKRDERRRRRVGREASAEPLNEGDATAAGIASRTRSRTKASVNGRVDKRILRNSGQRPRK